MVKREKTAIDIATPACEIQEEQIERISPPSYDEKEQWVQEYIKQFGEEPSFF